MSDANLLELIFVRTLYMPMGVKNYGLGAMDIRAKDILLASIISGIPFALLWSYIGSTAKNFTEILSSDSRLSLRSVFLRLLPDGWGGILIIVGALIFGTVMLHIRLKYNRASASIRREDEIKKGS